MFVWSKLSAAKWEDAWEERLSGFGLGNVVITRLAGRKSVRVEFYTPRRVEAEQVRRLFGGTVRSLPRTNWAAMAGPPPVLVKIRDRLLISSEPSPARRRELAASHPGRQVIHIPVEMAFGTGDHATTASCLRFLADTAAEWRREGRRGWRMLDLGTGTGILAIAGRMLGAGSVLACDFDPQAVRVARKNAAAHGFGDGSLRVEERDVRSWDPAVGGYDVVTANLFSAVLAEVFPKIRRALAPGAACIVSGILRDQEETCRRSATEAGLDFPDAVRRGKWAAWRGRAA